MTIADDRIAARYAIDRAIRLKAQAEEAKLDCEAFAAELGDAEKALAAMRAARELLARLFETWRADLPGELAAMESQDAIHARMSEVVREGLGWLSGALHDEARALAGVRGSEIDKLIDHAGAAYLDKAANWCRPRANLTVSQWADEHRWLSSKGSGEPGKWETARNPLLREIMDCFSVSSPVRVIVIKKPSQFGATEVVLNVIGYTMDYAPAPMLMLVPTLESRDKWASQKLNPLLNETPVLADLFDANARRDASNSKDMKEFPGGVLYLGGGNSPNSYAQVSARIAIADDYARFPREVGDEGDTGLLLRGRTKGFSRYKLGYVSTPTIKDACNIDDEYEKSDQSVPWVACPHCGEYQPLVWASLKWTRDLATRQVTHAWYVCEKNGCVIEEHDKPEMIADGKIRWIAKHPERSAQRRGFTWNSVDAPIGLGKTWPELAQQWLEAQGNPGKLKVFINTELGEVWEDRTGQLKPAQLVERALKELRAREIPPGCLMLAAGVDVQRGTRLEVQVLGIGPLPGGRVGQDFIVWTIDYAVIEGDPAQDKVWQDLADYLNKPFTNTRHRELFIEATAIDEGDGFHTHDVRAFAMSGKARRLMSVKGLNRPSRSLMPGAAKPVELNRRGKADPRGAKMWDVGTDVAKKYLYARLEADVALPAGEQRIRFHGELEDSFYKGLLAEVFDPEKNKFVKRKGMRRNEAVDTWVYGWFAAHHPQISIARRSRKEWDDLAILLEPALREDGTPVPTSLMPARPAKKPTPAKTYQPTGGSSHGFY